MSEPDPYLQARMEAIMRAPWLPPDLDRAIEPKLVSEGPQGDPDGPGRGDLTARQLTRLEALRGFRLAGYTD